MKSHLFLFILLSGIIISILSIGNLENNINKNNLTNNDISLAQEHTQKAIAPPTQTLQEKLQK